MNPELPQPLQGTCLVLDMIPGLKYLSFFVLHGTKLKIVISSGSQKKKSKPPPGPEDKPACWLSELLYECSRVV